MRVGVTGCGHGQLDALFARAVKEDVSLLIVGGDFQAFRTRDDMATASIPPKYRAMGDFHKYWSGQAQVPVTTVFVGGNHEAMGFMNELAHGGYVCPRIYYLGAAGCVTYGGLRIAGISGIYNERSYDKTHFERVPFDDRTVRSVYHMRRSEVDKMRYMSVLLQERHQRIDIFLTHDWPRGVHAYGDEAALLRQKPFFRTEVREDRLGNPATRALLDTLQPAHWFASHLHVAFEATVEHGAVQLRGNEDEIDIEADLAGSEDEEQSPDRKRQRRSDSPVAVAPLSTHFLALDKCLPGRDYFRVVDVAGSALGAPAQELEFHVDPAWAAIETVLGRGKKGSQAETEAAIVAEWARLIGEHGA